MNALIAALADLLAPLALALTDAEALSDLLQELGWDIDLDASPLEAFETIGGLVVSVVDISKTLAEKAKDKAKGGLTPAEIKGLIESAQGMFKALGGDASKLGSFADPVLRKKEFWDSLAADLPMYLVTRWLSDGHPEIYGALRVARIAVDTVVAEDEDTGRAEHVRTDLLFERIPELMSDPSYLPRVWGFTGPGPFEHALLTYEVAEWLCALGMVVRRQPVRDVFWTGPSPRFNAQPDDLYELDIPFVSEASGGASVELGLIVLPVPGDGEDNAIVVANLASGAFDQALPVRENWTATVKSELDVSGVVGVEVRSSGPPSPFLAGQLQGELSISVEGRAPEGQPWLILGDADGTRLEMLRFQLGAGLSVGAGADANFSVALPYDPEDPALRLVIDVSSADGLQNKLISLKPIVAELGIEVLWSTAKGFQIGGGGELTFNLVLNKSLGPITLETIEIKVAMGMTPPGRANPAILGVTVAIDVAANLGPFAARVEGIGAKVYLAEATDGAGLLGPYDLDFGFKPPTGAGFSIDTGVVAGGGFLSFEPDIGRYTGMLALRTPTFGFSAIGIVTTKPKDPQLAAAWRGPDFSLFLALCATFEPPIQLGYGFGLGGVGGIFAANRRMDAPAIRAAVRAGSLDVILFPNPATVVKEADRIFSTIESIFPLHEGCFVFGPMLQVTWGVPKAIVKVMLGVFVSLPEPVVIALLGRIQLALPDEESGILLLNMDIAGILDFGEGMVSLDGTLHDSTLLLAFALMGDFAFRLRWKGEPSFLLSVGGFHPAFDPPADVGKLQRMGVGIVFQYPEDVELEKAQVVVNLIFQKYLALTANTLQFGSGVVMKGYLNLEVIKVDFDGWFGFDALMTFKPFAFRADVTANLSVSLAGAELAGVSARITLQGPNPNWTISGEASVRHPGGTIPAGFATTIGKPKPEEIPPEAVRQPLHDALKEPGNWSEGAGLDRLVRLRELRTTEADGRVWTRPDGRIEVRQRVIPLGIRLEQMGPADPKETEQGPYTLKGTTGVSEPLYDYFAPATFLDLSEHEKLTGRSFERMQSGIAFGDASVQVDPNFSASGRESTWEPKPWKPEGTVPTVTTEGSPEQTLRRLRKRRGEVGKAALSLNVAGRSFGLNDPDTARTSAEALTWTAARQRHRELSADERSKRSVAPSIPTAAP